MSTNRIMEYSGKFWNKRLEIKVSYKIIKGSYEIIQGESKLLGLLSLKVNIFIIA